jgi:hypothetical protein
MLVVVVGGFSSQGTGRERGGDDSEGNPEMPGLKDLQVEVKAEE